MITEDQSAVIDFLTAPSAHGGATVERIDTHPSSFSRVRGRTNSSAPFGSTISTSQPPSAAAGCVRRKFASIGGRRQRSIVASSPSLATTTDPMHSGETEDPLTGWWR
jgi:hypothetical protein